ncbi:MAG: tetratricopeptide repeat protein [Deltaproteobacteria bacterium]|nr:tetratricopeptide repeat protein [Deltaproteobacteria bacterium]
MAFNRDKVLEAASKYVEKKKYDKAVVEYQKLIEADPNDARTLLKIGDLQAKQSLHAEAISTYETVGKLYAHQGFALKAIAVYKQIREIIAKHVPQLEERYGHITPKLAELYQQLGLTSDALAALDEVATRLQRQQKDPEAIEVFRKIVELDPTNPLPHLRLAEALSRVKDIDGAVQEFKTAASQLAGIGRRDDALKVLERLLHHKPDAEQARICAELYLSRGQQQDGMQALSKLQICFQANPRDFDTLSLLARAFNAIGQGTKAIEVQKEMARVARDSGKQDLFREIVERLMRVAPQDEGVRKLATQSGSVGANAPAYGSAAVQGAPTGGHQAAMQQSGGYPASQQFPQHAQLHAQQQHGVAQPPPPPISRPGTNSGGMPPALPRPITAAQFPPSVPEEEEAVDEGEVEELSYEEVDAEEVLEAQQAAAEFEAQTEDGDAVVEYGTAEDAEAEQYTDPSADAYEQQTDGYEQATAEGYETATAEGYEQGAEGYEQPAEGYEQSYEEGVASSGESPDSVEHIQKALADANAFRRVRLYNKALETLRAGLEIDPRSMDIHEVYRDILIESGQTEEAVQEMLVIASLYVDSLDGESAARALQDVLAFDPQNARAIEMLQELGYEIVDETDEAGTGEVDAGEAAYEQVEELQEAEASVEAEGQSPLPSYDLEEMGAADVSPQYADDRQVYVGRSASQAPAAEAGLEGDDSLPSFPLDEPDADMPSYAQHDDMVEAAEIAHASSTVRPDAVEIDAEPDDDKTGYFAGGALGVAPVAVPRPGAAPAAPVAAAPSGPPSRELEDALDEAEFFCSRGLLEDARAILQEQLGRHPNNPLLRERIAEIDAQEQQRGSGARERPRENDRSFDIAASLDALESLDYGVEPQPAEGFAAPDQQVDVEEVFAKFKEGVAKQISVDDSDSHYNLGIAYKEMMLVDDAIREFEVAARDPKRECVCRSMIGMIEIERGNLNEAIDAFLQGLNASIKDPQQETVLCYEIGAAYEAKKMSKEALSYYQKAMRRDPNYRDVQERVRRLAKNEPKAPLRQAAVGADDEFDRAFDDLLSKA